MAVSLPSVRDLFDQVRLAPGVHQRLRYWVYGPEYRAWRRANPCPEFARRTELYRFLLDDQGLGGPIDYLEFGVYQGDSIRWWVENNRDPDSTFAGFDSFEGLPEDWHRVPKGSFTTGGRLPAIDDPRCRFVKGLFQETLPGWLAGRGFSRRIVLHMDADLYNSTLVVLSQLIGKFKPGDLLIFDNFRSYLDEYRAFREVIGAYYREFRTLGRAEGWSKVALRAV